MPGTSLSTYNPSLRDRLAWMMGDIFGDNRTMRNWAQDKVRGAVDFVPVVGDAVGFDEAKRDFDAGNYGSAATNAGLSLVGSVPGLGDAAAGAAKGMIMGPLSNLWRADMHAKAMDMADQGKDARNIWQETGNYFDWANRSWRQEVPDFGARADRITIGLNNLADGGDVYLGDVYDHPLGKEAYPDLFKNVSMISPDPGDKSYGTFFNSHPRRQGASAISINTDNLLDPFINPKAPKYGEHFTETGQRQQERVVRDTLAHEVQHAVQSYEGFLGKGSNPEWERSALRIADSIAGETYLKSLRQDANVPEFFKGAGDRSILDQTADLINFRPNDEITQYLLQQHVDPASYQAYRRNAGETQSRLVESRMGLLPAAARNVEPPAYMDIPWEQQALQGILARKWWGG